MYSVLMLGALAAMASPQQPEKKMEMRLADPEPHLQVEIPAVEIPAIDFYLPELSFEIPSVQPHGDELALHTTWINIPAVEFAVPEISVEFPFAAEWHGSREAHVQDMELDTIFEVNPNATLRLRNHAGEIIIRTWDRNQVRVQASYSSDDRVKVFASSSAVGAKVIACAGVNRSP